MLTILSPAKNLDLEPLSGALPSSTPVFLKDTAVLSKRCKQLSTNSLKKLMSISDKLATLNHQRFQDFQIESPAGKQAALTFNGDVYRGLDAATLSPQDHVFANDHLAILSGLYGLLRPLDLIQPYRLEMGTRLNNTRGKNLYAFWGKRISTQINTVTQSHSDPTLVNLASGEYFKAIQSNHLQVPVVTPVFKEEWNGQSKVISFMAKRARGMMARYAIQQRLEAPEGLKEFTDGGYKFARQLSDDTTWVFTRPKPPPASAS